MKITILDPAMCCNTGVCGPEADDQLVQTAANVRWLKSLGHEIHRHNLGNDAIAFKQYPRALQLLQQEGSDALPFVLIDDTIIMMGRYPDKTEWASMISSFSGQPVPMTDLNVLENSDDTACCAKTGC